MKNSRDTIGNRTSNLPACSTVPQPTAPLRTPVHLYPAPNYPSKHDNNESTAQEKGKYMSYPPPLLASSMGITACQSCTPNHTLYMSFQGFTKLWFSFSICTHTGNRKVPQNICTGAVTTGWKPCQNCDRINKQIIRSLQSNRTPN
jgi:hypothetical protein